MNITTGVQLQQYLQTGGHVQLGEHGLESQSAISHFFQSIGDAFRSLTQAGRTALIERNTRLQDSMAALLREPDALPNLAETRLADATVKGHVETAVLTRMAVANMVRGEDPDVPGTETIPQEGRKHVQEAILKILDQYPPADKSVSGLRAKAGSILSNLLATPCFTKACLSSFDVAPERATLLQDTMHQSSEQTYLSQKNRYINADGFHDSYLKDALRNSIESINGEPLRQAPVNQETRFLDKKGQPFPPREQGILEQLAETIPDKKMRGFVSMIASQAGIEGDLAIPLCGMGPLPTDQMANGIDLQANGMTREPTEHKMLLSTDENTIRVTCRMTFQDKLLNAGDGMTLGESPVLSTNKYEVTVTIPLHQDMANRDIPEYSVSGFRHLQE